MKKSTAVVLAIAAVGAILYFVLGGEPEGAGEAATGAVAAEGPAHEAHGGWLSRVTSHAAPAQKAASAGPAVDAAEEARPGETPPLAVPATEKDGFAVIEVKNGGKPVAHAEVHLYLRGPRDRATGHAAWRVAGHGNTGADGLAHLPARPGNYLASAQSGQLAIERREFVRPQGEHATRVVLELKPGATLIGRTVTGSTQEAVPLATITLTEVLRGGGGGGGGGRGGGMRRPDAPPEEQPHATGDAHGRFRVDGLASGAWRVEAQAPGYAKSAAARVTVPHADEVVLTLLASAFIEGTVVGGDGKPAGGAQVVAQSGPARAVAVASDQGAFSLEVEPRAYKLSAQRGKDAGTLDRTVSVAPGATEHAVIITLGPGSSIEGTVVNAGGGAPIPGAQISLSPTRGEGAAGAAVSDQAGAFTLDGLAPGSYDVSTTAQGYGSDQRRGITVMQGQKFPLQIQLQGVGAVEGIVKSAITSTPVAGAHVTAASSPMGAGRGGFGPGGGGGPDTPQEVLTDTAGHYRLDGLTAGHTMVQARRDGSDLGASQAVDIVSGGTAPGDFQLRDEGVLTGRVTLKSGAPLTSTASVRAMPNSGGFWGGGGGGPPAGTVDPTGGYRMVLPAGSYSVIASTDSAAGFGIPRSRNVAIIDAGQTTNKDLQLEDEASDVGLSGVVLEPGGAPSAGAMVSMSNGGGPRMMTDDQGKFQVAGTRASLPSVLQVNASNGGRTGQAAVVDGQTQVTIQLVPGAKLTGHATGSTPVQGFQVSVATIGSSGMPMRMSGQTLEFAADTFQIDDVPPGQVQVSINTRDGRAGQATAQVVSGQTGTVDVALKDVVSASGRILNPDGTPAGSARAFADEGPPTPGGLTTADGRFTLANLLPGAHTLNVFLPPSSHKTQAFTIVAGQPLDLGDVTLDAPAASPGTIGASIRQDGEAVTVIYVLPQGPADVGGLKLGDTLAAVDGVQVSNVSDATARVQGTPGTQVTLAVRRAGNATTVVATRAQ